MNSSKIAGKLREQINRFAGEFSHLVNKAKAKFIEEMIYGIQASKDALALRQGAFAYQHPPAATPRPYIPTTSPV